jgi:Ca2+-binding EF-hand superfamily protein
MKKLILALAIASTTAYAANDRVAQYDFDKDGKVSFEEIGRVCNVSKALFEKADKNGDGFLSNAEMSIARRYIFARCMNTIKVA